MSKLSFEDMQNITCTLEINSDVTSTDESDLYLSREEALGILKKTISTYYITNSLSNQSNTAHFRRTNTFFVSFLALINGLKRSENINIDELSHVLDSWRMQRVNTPKDGNCLFRSVAFVC